MKIFRKKDRLYGNHLKYSKLSMEHCPEMIDDRYNKLIKETEIELENIEKAHTEIYNKVYLLLTPADALDVTELIRDENLRVDVNINSEKVNLEYNNFIFKTFYDTGCSQALTTYKINGFYSIDIKTLKNRIKEYEEQNIKIIRDTEERMSKAKTKLNELISEYEEFKNRLKKQNISIK